MRKEMENRLINFSVVLYEMSKNLDNSFAATHLANQILRSSTGAALNFAEAQAAESRKDFIHKTSIVLKELRETNVNLHIIMRINMCKDIEKITSALQESEYLSFVISSVFLPPPLLPEFLPSDPRALFQ